MLSPTAGAVDPPPDGGYPNQNTAEGEDALFSLTTGTNNTAVGFHALYRITDSSENTAVGNLALANATAGPNTAVGSGALHNNTTGINNTAVDGLYANTTGTDNTSVGFSALVANTTGSFNTAVGGGALGGNGSHNCAFGGGALEPVSFRYKKELDPEGIPQFGLVAEQVEKVAPELTARDNQGRPYSVRYEAVNTMLLNEFLKEHRKAEERGTTIKAERQRVEQLEATVAQLQSAFEKQAKQLRRVSNRLRAEQPKAALVVSD